MGLGSTAKKVQLVAETAEKMYSQVQELQGRITTLESAVDETHDTVTDLENDIAQQRALLETMAEEQGLDVEAILAEVAVAEEEAAETGTDEDADATTEA